MAENNMFNSFIPPLVILIPPQVHLITLLTVQWYNNLRDLKLMPVCMHRASQFQFLLFAIIIIFIATGNIVIVEVSLLRLATSPANKSCNFLKILGFQNPSQQQITVQKVWQCFS